MRCAARLARALLLGAISLALGCGYYSQGAKAMPPRHQEIADTPPSTQRDEAATPQHEEVADTPPWISQGCQNYWPAGEPRAVICGVGMARGSKNAELMRTTAISRGRAELSRVLDAGVRAMLTDYASSTAGKRELGEPSESKSYVVVLSQRITQRSLAGARTEADWSSNSQTLYALVSLDVETFADAVNGMDQLSTSLRTALVERAGIWFPRLGRDSQRSSAQ